MSYDLFISYSRHDNEQSRVTELVERIKQNFAPFAKRELMTFFDQQAIDGMQDWRQRILQGLRESRLLLACLSPAYLQSDYCEWEFVEYLKYEIGHLYGFNGVAPIYFVVVTGWDDKDFDKRCAAWVAELRRRQNFDLRPWHDLGEEALRQAAVRERMEKLNHQIAETILRGERAEKSLGNVDAHNPHFIGRLANLRMLRDNFVKPGHIGVVTAVNGVGGLGKTALAIEYAQAFANEYGGGRWQVRCAGKDDLRLALAELATPIGFEFTDDEEKNADMQCERTRRELKRLTDAHEPHRCLLLLDNVDRPSLLDPAQVARLNGGDWLHVLATTQLGENELYGSHRDRSFLGLRSLVAKTFPEMERDAEPGYPDPWKNVVRRLMSLRLLQTTNVSHADRQPRLVRIHRLVQELVKGRARESIKERHLVVVAHTFECSEELERHWHEPDWQWEIRPLLTFTRALLDSADTEGAKLVKWLCEWITQTLPTTESETLVRSALATLESTPKTEPTEIAIMLNNLAGALWRQARFSEAEGALRRALGIDALRQGRHDLVVNTLPQPDTQIGSIAGRILKDSLDRAVLFQRSRGKEQPEVGSLIGGKQRPAFPRRSGTTGSAPNRPPLSGG